MISSPRQSCESPYENAETTDYGDSKKEFVAGDVIGMTCKAGFTTDGSDDKTKNSFDVSCLETGVFETKGVCMLASKCGALPRIAHAKPIQAHACGP